MFDIPEVTRKLMIISRIMSDGYHYVNLRFLVEELDRRSHEGDKDAAALIDIINKFYNLCMYVEKTNSNNKE